MTYRHRYANLINKDKLTKYHEGHDLGMKLCIIIRKKKSLKLAKSHIQVGIPFAAAKLSSIDFEEYNNSIAKRDPELETPLTSITKTIFKMAGKAFPRYTIF